MPSFSVRAASTDAEHDQFYRLATTVFQPNALLEEHARAGRQYTESDPWYVPSQVRGALQDTTLVGGYMLYRRPVCIGDTVVQTACIGVVCTHPDFRMQGVATALMQDAVQYANIHHDALIMLDGIADFYHRFGFLDMFDTTRHAVQRQRVLELPVPPGYCVRPAQLNDATATLAVYEQIFGRYTGRFARTPDWQRWLLAGRQPDSAYVVHNPSGSISGYLVLPRSAERLNAIEVLAHDWPSALALLQQHARIASDESAPELSWPLPADADLAYDLADHLYVTSRTVHHPTEGWQARPGHLPTLFEHVRALWLARHPPGWRIPLRVQVDDAEILLEPFADSAATSSLVRLTPQALVQLLFGYRPIRRLIGMPGIDVPPTAMAALEALFPHGNTWIAGGDAF